LVVFFSEIAGKEIADHGVTLLKEMKQNPASPLNMQDKLGDDMHRLRTQARGSSGCFWHRAGRNARNLARILSSFA
jgi:hypothetical protein